jgi:hypothetical protein
MLWPPPFALSQRAWTLVCPPPAPTQADKIAVLVGTVTDDVRLHEVPKLRVAALRFTETARARIAKVRDAVWVWVGVRGGCRGGGWSMRQGGVDDAVRWSAALGSK